MEIARLVLDYLQTLIWPLVVLFALLRYREVIQSLIPCSKIKVAFAGVSIETSLDTLQRSFEESFRGRPVSAEQWSWLERLYEAGRLPYDHNHYGLLSPLRNGGLIREHPEGHLTSAKEIEITTLGRLLLEARRRGKDA